ncbi:hypothetical protein G432_05100 [Sphingomonas sp. MM-1]|uniref:hypothetical protein n=1 Tax=Sphingomonas sp. MM-1 TaxID=745310 RepID=UPI0002C04989|nr:hypothetical protein [Sphingomonas sp. MM-1]AGH48747.1 hypothetical protein G432_05100 [Sphingomonas sp. MM-1]
MRPVPDDFAALAATMSRAQMQAHYRVRSSTLSAWYVAAGLRPPVPSQQRPAPADFAEHGRRPSAELRERYGCSNELLARWRKQHGISMADGPTARPVPEDFAIRARSSTNRELAEHYGVGRALISRWRAKCGLSGGISTYRWKVPTPTQVGARDSSLAGRAADHLRLPRAGSWVVFRCDAAGTADPSGGHFRVGTRLMTEDEMIQFAERKGFAAFPADALGSSRQHGAALS